MSRVFVDTSAILALRVATDESHPAAKRALTINYLWISIFLVELNQVANLRLNPSGEPSG